MKAVGLIGLAALGLSACSHSQPPRPIRYILDSGATGWVKITYNRAGAPELPVEGGFSVVHIPLDMKIVTRSRMNPTWDGSEFYYQSADGKRVRLTSKDDAQRRLWGLDKTTDTDGERETFFVGKDSQFTHTSAQIERIDNQGELVAPAVKAIESSDKPLSLSPDDRTKILTTLPK